MEPFGFFMADLTDGNPTDPVNGENVAYVADAEMGIARYDYSEVGSETTRSGISATTSTAPARSSHRQRLHRR